MSFKRGLVPVNKVRGGIVYDDLQVSIGRVRLGSSAPTWRTYNYGIGGGLTFDVLGFAVNNYIEFNVQTKHAMKLDSILDVHMHFLTPNVTDIGDKFQFQLDVVGAGITYTWAVPTGSPFTAEHTINGFENVSHRFLDLADIPAVNTTVSTIYKCKLTRIAASSDEYGSEVYIDFIDCHFRKDSVGSLNEGSKGY